MAVNEIEVSNNNKVTKHPGGRPLKYTRDGLKKK